MNSKSKWIQLNIGMILLVHDETSLTLIKVFFLFIYFFFIYLMLEVENAAYQDCLN